MLVSLPGLVVADYPFLYVASRGIGGGLVATALAASTAKLRCGTTKAILTTANIQGTSLARRHGIFSALGMGIVIAPTVIVGRLARGATIFVTKATEA